MEDIKAELMDYWAGRVEKFEQLRLDEWNSDMRRRWLSELRRCLPKGEKLSILDIGTGTGFFAFILAAEGHSVTGIDLTTEMIDGARRTGELLGLYPSFRVMDAEAPDFAPGSFDAIVTRNLTTFLPRLPEAYKCWYGLLREGGALVNFDGDYNYAPSEGPLPENHAHKGLTADQNAAYARISGKLRQVQKPRPDWDVELLERAGFRDIQVDREVWRRVYREIDRFYNPTPIFCITARRA